MASKKKRSTADSTTRDRILKVAARIFADRGYGMTPMRAIARAARIRVATLYHHFKSKDDLYLEVLDRGQAELRELINRILAEETDFRAQIERMVTVAFDYLLKNPSLARLSLRAALGDGLSRPYDERWLGMMEVMLRPRAVKGEIKDIDPALFLITQSAVITQHVIANGTYRDLVGKSVSTTEAETRTREHLKQVVLRSLGLDEKTPGGER